MANPAWIPLIGSGFDDLARQRQWAVGRNDQVDAANLNRLATAQQTQNSYLQQLSERQQQEIDRQVRAQEDANQNALTRQDRFSQAAVESKRYDAQTAEQKRQFEIGQKFAEKTLATQKEEATAKFNFAQLQQEQKIQHAGEVHATQYAELTHDEEVAQKRLDDIQELNTTKAARMAELRAKKKPTAQETAELAQLPIELKTAQQQEKAASRGLEAISRAKVGRIASMSSQGFSPDDTAGKIVHEPTGQAFNFRQALKAAKSNPMTDEAVQSTNTIRNQPGWVGPGASTATENNPAAAPAYSTPDDVKSAFQRGVISREQARQILNQQFGMPLQ